MSEYTRPPVTENTNKVSYAHEVSVRFSLYGVDIIIAVAASHGVLGIIQNLALKCSFF